MDLVLVVWTKDSGQIELKTWDRITLLQFESETEAVKKGVSKQLLKDKTKIRVSLNVEEFRFEKFSSTRKPFATSFNRIVDQIRKRRAKMAGDSSSLPPIFQAPPITFTDIMNSIR
jgi:predicted HAD superfamily phosphohydrolase YqeG